ncbi:MAG: sugar ABC transporter permease [Chloroflexales bacterium]|nr:sugar ABC transporter permease [Chloroflexales bacterium]
MKSQPQPASQQRTPAHTASGPQATRLLPTHSAWRGYRLRRNLSFLLMALPGLLLLAVFAYLPMFGIVIAFKEYRAVDGIWGSAWAGLDNFRFLFGSQDAWRITHNTLLLNTLFILSNLVASLALALLLYELRSPWMTTFYQSALFFPFVISWVIVGYFAFAFLNTNNGLLNQILAQFGIGPTRWYAAPQYWQAILTLVSLWKSAGFGCVIYLAGMLAINPEYYEAARVDGASKWQQTWSITLPLLQPLIVINVLLAVGRIFYADFGLFYNVTRDSSQLYPTTDVIDTYVFRALRTTGDVGMAAAAGFYQAVVGFVLVILSNWLVRRVDAEKALF